MKKSFKFLCSSGVLLVLLLTSCGLDNGAMDTTEDTGTYGQDHPAVGTDDNTGSNAPDTNRTQDGSGINGNDSSNNTNLP